MTADNIELIAAYFTLAGDVYPFGPTQISPFPFRDRVEAAARAGWNGIGLIPDDVQPQLDGFRVLHVDGLGQADRGFACDIRRAHQLIVSARRELHLRIGEGDHRQEADR